MKIVMLKDVAGVGKRDTVQDVSDGFALNKLIPQKAAHQATPDALRALSARTKVKTDSEEQRKSAWEHSAKKLEGTTIEVRARVNPQGRLYQQLSSSYLVARLVEGAGVMLPPEAIIMNAPLQNAGITDVELKFGTHIVHLKVNVIAE